MLSKLRQLFKRGGQCIQLNLRDANIADPLDLDWDWMIPPADPLDVSAWDRYWTEHVRHEIGPAGFDIFSDDRGLVAVMNSEGMKSVLCAGSGISQEPRALAQAGFQVVALDRSPQAMEIARGYEFPPEGFEYFCEPEMRRPGGHVEFVTGDILDPAVCPGPFDVIIERRTAQLYFTRDMGAVLSELEKRLGQEGIFLSHCHDGRWKGPAAPHHFTKSWFEENRWTIWSGRPGRKPPGRVAWLITSTG